METEKKPRFPSPFCLKTCWAALTGVSLLVIVALVCGLVLGLGYIFVSLEAVLLPLIIAGILAYLLYPIVLFVQKYLKKRLPSVLLVLSLAALLVMGFVLVIVPPLVKQTGELIASRAQIYEKVVDTTKDVLAYPLVARGVDLLYHKTIKDLKEEGQEVPPVASGELSSNAKLLTIVNFHTGYFAEKLIAWLTAGTQAVSGLVAAIIGAVMVPVFLFYFLLESEKIQQNWHTIIPLRHSRFREELIGTLLDINSYIIAFIRGQMLVSLIDGVLLAIGLKILGLPYAITIGAASAIFGMIPYIGNILTCIPALFIAWFTWQDPSYLIWTAAIFIFVNQFDSWVVQPRVIGKQVGMHDMVVMFSVLFWSMVLGGIVGALLAVPLTASLKVIFSRYVWTSFIGEKKKKGAETGIQITES